ncbi:MAG: pyruvate kinase [Candidatus Gracilibacteria bacterium]
MKKTKIIATIGPVSEASQVLKRLASEGVDIIRLNFSHGTYEWFGNVIKRVQEINETRVHKLSIMLDTKGPEIRTSGDMQALTVKQGTNYTMAHMSIMCDIPVSYEYIVRDCKKGQLIQLDGGKIQAKVTEKKTDMLVIKMLNSGVLTAKRHVNLPGVHVTLPILGEQDKKDIAFGIGAGIDIIAASFVNTAEDIEKVREEIAKHTDRYIPIIAKIESHTAVENIDEILHATDAIMIARGDLSVEIPYYKVATVQEMLMSKAILAQKPVIMATQMLLSMVSEPTPTRAEVTDVANAVFGQVDCIMLSDESTVGKFPVKCIEVMTNIAKEVEQNNKNTLSQFPKGTEDPEWELFRAGVEYAEGMKVKALVLMSDDLNHIRLLDAMRPITPIKLVTRSIDTAAYASLMRGVETTVKASKENLRIGESLEVLKTNKSLKAGDKIVIFYPSNAGEALDSMQLIIVK